MASDKRRAVLAAQHLAEPRDVIGECGHRKLGSRDVVTTGLQPLDDRAPAGAIGPRAVDKNDVHLSFLLEGLRGVFDVLRLRLNAGVAAPRFGRKFSWSVALGPSHAELSDGASAATLGSSRKIRGLDSAVSIGKVLGTINKAGGPQHHL
jgi:hypothetical protein